MATTFYFAPTYFAPTYFSLFAPIQPTPTPSTYFAPTYFAPTYFSPFTPIQSTPTPSMSAISGDHDAYAANGLDSIAVEQGINAGRALAPILAASAGMVTGAGTGTILIRGANVTTTRITATTDNAGNRSSVTLSLPT
jgi:hypothetical protein